MQSVDDVRLAADAALEEYEVNDGLIVSFGKFEGEPVWAPYFYGNDCDESVVDVDDMEYRAYLPTEEEKAVFKDLADVDVVVLREDDQGFVRVSALSNQVWKTIASSIEEAVRKEEARDRFGPQ